MSIPRRIVQGRHAIVVSSAVKACQSTPTIVLSPIEQPYGTVKNSLWVIIGLQSLLKGFDIPLLTYTMKQRCHVEATQRPHTLEPTVLR